MGAADWDLDSRLRCALSDPKQKNQIQDILDRYDMTYEIVIRKKIALEDKYKQLYKITTNANH